MEPDGLFSEVSGPFGKPLESDGILSEGSGPFGKGLESNTLSPVESALFCKASQFDGPISLFGGADAAHA